MYSLELGLLNSALISINVYIYIYIFVFVYGSCTLDVRVSDEKKNNHAPLMSYAFQLSCTGPSHHCRSQQEIITNIPLVFLAIFSIAVIWPEE